MNTLKSIHLLLCTIGIEEKIEPYIKKYELVTVFNYRKYKLHIIKYKYSKFG